jgi:hypothetical protein
MRTTEYNIVPGRAHHGFVAVDPEGYFLEFERFNPHPENELLMPVLDVTDTLFAHPDSNVPEGLGFKATVVWFYYKVMAAMQRFYEDTLGFGLIVDQGWAKVYSVGPTGYFGLVDEKRGMHKFTETKAVILSLITADIDGWYDYAKENDGIECVLRKYQTRIITAPSLPIDPEGYYLEWDIFKASPENTNLVQAITAE